MIKGNKTIIDDFTQYLSEKVSPSQLSGLYFCFSEIENFCLKVKVLHKPLFETTDFETIKKVRQTIEQNKIFRVTHKRQYNKILIACRQYYLYIKEGHFPQGEKQFKEECKDRSKNIEAASQKNAVGNASVETQIVRTNQDERLLQKYPIVYKQVYNALINAGCSLSIEIICNKIGRIARSAVLEEILDSVSWAKWVENEYSFSTEIEEHHIVANEVNEKSIVNEAKTAVTYVIDFNSSFDLTYSKPISFTYFGAKKEFGNTWVDLYIAFFEAIHEDHHHLLKPGMSFSKTGTRVELAENTNYDLMIDPKHIPGTNLMLETNVSAKDVASKIKYVLELCGIDFENIIIGYIKKNDVSPSKEECPTNPSRRGASGYSADFYNFLSKRLGMAEATCRSYVSAINNCESFAKEHHFVSWQLYGVQQTAAEETIKLLMADEAFQKYTASQHNRFRTALQKYLLFVGSEAVIHSTAPEPYRTEVAAPYRNEEYEMMLSRFFQKGFRMESPLEIRKFRRYYSSTYEKELLDSDDEISCNIRKLAIEYDGKAFLPVAMLNDEVKAQLYAYIDSAFAEGKKAIYYQALYAEFAETFLDHHIHNADMLKAYLSATANGKFYVQKNFISKEENVTIDPLSEIRKCLIEYGRPVEYEELFEALPHIPQKKIKYLLASNGEFINNGQGTYFHEKTVRLSDDELESIAEIISCTIEDKDYMGGNELYDAIKAKYGYIIEDNKLLSIYGFRDALSAKLGDRFSFKGNIISRYGNELSMADVFAKYAQTHDSFTLSELQELASNLATVIYFDAVYENSLRVSKEQFVSKEMAQFAISETDDVLDRICLGKYIPICEVQNFGIFPYGGFTWNSYLLEHYVASYSHKYKLLHRGFSETECAGAIVRRSANINSFDDLIVDILVNDPIELNQSSVLQYLSDKGYLVRRRYSEIESLMIKAKAQKQRRGD